MFNLIETFNFKSFKYIINVILIGPNGYGKTTLLNTITNSGFQEDFLNRLHYYLILMLLLSD
jgi:ABC-type branched-subunit amino acid transport system ATPase component